MTLSQDNRPSVPPVKSHVALHEQQSRAAAQSAMTRAFAEIGIATPALDARLLLQGILNIDAAGLLLHPDLPLGPAAPLLMHACQRRLTHEPVHRILARRGFYGLEFEVTPDTLDPRPETETLVDVVLDIVARENWQTRPLRILDYGTGTGCLIVTILDRLKSATGLAADVSGPALEVARRNARRHGVSDRVSWVEADGVGRLCTHAPFDIVVSNPPYIPSGHLSALCQQVRDFDPWLALDGGPDGLRHYRQLASHAAALAPQGWTVVEVGASQAADVAEIATLAAPTGGQPVFLTAKDLAGHTRCVAWKTQ